MGNWMMGRLNNKDICYKIEVACQASKCSQYNCLAHLGRPNSINCCNIIISSRQCLWHQLNPNTTKQKLKSFNGILDLLMNVQDSSSCH